MARNVVFIHGIFGNGNRGYWENYRSLFESAGYVCHTPTLPGHDVSPADPVDPLLGKLGLKDYVQSLEALIETLPERPILVGHSLGGLLAQILASRGLVSAAVLITPAPPAGIVDFSFSQIKCSLPTFMTWRFWEKPFRFNFETHVYGAMNRMPPDSHRQLFEELVHESGKVLMEISLWPFFIDRPSAVDEKTVTCPILVIGAGKDRLVPISTARKVARKYGQSNYREYVNHAHWIIGEPGWEHVAKEIIEWVGKHDAVAT